VVFSKRAYRPRQKVRGGNRAGADVNIPACLVLQFPDFFARLPAQPDHAHGGVVKDFALRRQRNAGMAAVDHCCVQALFDMADIFGERRLREQHPLGRPAETALLHQADERFELLQRQII